MGEHGVFSVVRSQMEELGHQNLNSDSLSSALSNGENRISSFLLVTSIHGSVRFGVCTQTIREMAKNGVLFDGVEANGGVGASKLNSFLVFICSIE